MLVKLGSDFLIYLDNAATSGKKPQTVINAVERSMKLLSANPGRGGHKPSVTVATEIYKVREKISNFFNASGPQNVAFCANCTHAINFVIKGVLNENDHVIISDLEHNAVLRPLHKTVKDYSKATVFFDDNKKTLESFRSLVKDNTKMIICTAASNVTGRVLPLKAIGEMCKEKGILFAVDAAQGGGVIPIDIKEMNIDYLCLAPHKGFFAPMGTGVLIAEKPINNTVIEGGNGMNSLSVNQNTDLPEGFESGTVSVPNIMGIGAGIDYVNKIGREKIYAKEMQIINEFYDYLSKNDKVILYTPRPKIGEFAPVLSFNVSGKSSEEVAEFLDKNGIAVRGGFHCSLCAHEKLGTADVGAVRLSPSFSLTQNELLRSLAVFKKF
ncbi:MAG: aminotransferase class V-fold PLP-dependent enzyme [Clostridia bacterium]|nr:aminotransferase class V-fold PLP-dependent enzyme [Clostridia bacterium]